MSNLPTIHILHAENDISRFILECSVEADDVRGVAVMSDLEFPQDLLPYILLGIHADNLGAYHLALAR